MTVSRPWRIALRTIGLLYLAALLLVPVAIIFYRTFENGVERSGTRSRPPRRSRPSR